MPNPRPDPFEYFRARNPYETPGPNETTNVPEVLINSISYILKQLDFPAIVSNAFLYYLGQNNYWAQDIIKNEREINTKINSIKLPNIYCRDHTWLMVNFRGRTLCIDRPA